MRLTALAALVLAGACSAAAPTDPATSDMAAGEARAITARGRAIDGDTVSIDIRLSGADAFESRQLCRGNAGCWQCGKAAQDFAARALKSGDATIRLSGAASYGRPVGIVTIEGRDLGETMIAAGLAVPVTGYLNLHSPSGVSFEVKIACIRALDKDFLPQAAPAVAQTAGSGRIRPRSRCFLAQGRRFSAQRTDLSSRFRSV